MLAAELELQVSRRKLEVYGHLSPDYVLREIDKLKLGIAPEARRGSACRGKLAAPLAAGPRRRLEGLGGVT